MWLSRSGYAHNKEGFTLAFYEVLPKPKWQDSEEQQSLTGELLPVEWEHTIKVC